jgi:hypothetical protein
MSAHVPPSGPRPPRCHYLDLAAGFALAVSVRGAAGLELGAGLGRLDAADRMVRLDPSEALLLAGDVIAVALHAPNARAHLIDQITEADRPARPFDWSMLET